MLLSTLPRRRLPTAAQRPDLRRLTGAQLRTALEAAQVLRPHAREPFLQRVSALFDVTHEIDDGIVYQAIARAQRELYDARIVRL